MSEREGGERGEGERDREKRGIKRELWLDIDHKVLTGCMSGVLSFFQHVSVVFPHSRL